MEALLHGILLLCCGCILYGLLENLLPQRGLYPVIKAVVTLYILLILLSPVQSIGTPLRVREEAPLTPPTVETQGAQQGFLRQMSAALQKTLSDALLAAGEDVRLLRVEVQGTGTRIEAVRLFLQAGENGDVASAERLCDSLLGMEAAYEWENG